MKLIAILGNGVVGSGVAELINKNTEDKIKISKILVKNKEKHKNDLNYEYMTDKIEDILSEDIDIIVEVMGGIYPAYDYIKRFLENKKHVVTANKDLISKHGEELLKIAKENNVKLHFEASVGGGIPIIKSINEYLAGNKIKSIKAILNGTTNFILTKMHKENISYESALKAAQELGFAEADPTSDVKGYDSARKLAILSTLSYNKKFDWEKFEVIGIDDIDEADINKANRLGCTFKLLGLSQHQDDKIYASVKPVIINKNSMFGKVDNEFNCIVVEGDSIGELMFYGKGAGKLPTATAIYSNIIDIIKTKRENSVLFNSEEALIDNNLNQKTDWYIRIQCSNRHKIMDNLCRYFGNISIENNKGPLKNEIFVTVESEYEKTINDKLDELSQTEGVNKIKKFMILNNL